MNGWFDLAWLLCLLAGMAWLGAIVVVAALLPFANRGALLPVVRARRALMLASLPLAAPLALVASVCLLAIAKPLGLIADHCAYHGPGHPHLCFEHLPAIGIPSLHVGLVFVVFSGMVIAGARFAWRERRFARRLHTLARMAGSVPNGRRVRVVDDEQTFAFAARSGTSFVLMSRGLIKRLSRRERRIVVAHEAAHLRHGDLAWNRLFERLVLLQPPFLAARLRNAWRQAVEERADDTVVARFGHDDVASTLLKTLRLAVRDQQPAISVAGADPVRRIRRLVDRNPSVRTPPVFEFALAALLVSLAVVTAVSHHTLEALLGHLIGA